jgi:hypothetical protein
MTHGTPAGHRSSFGSRAVVEILQLADNAHFDSNREWHVSRTYERNRMSISFWKLFGKLRYPNDCLTVRHLQQKKRCPEIFFKEKPKGGRLAFSQKWATRTIWEESVDGRDLHKPDGRESQQLFE